MGSLNTICVIGLLAYLIVAALAVYATLIIDKRADETFKRAREIINKMEHLNTQGK